MVCLRYISVLVAASALFIRRADCFENQRRGRLLRLFPRDGRAPRDDSSLFMHDVLTVLSALGSQIPRLRLHMFYDQKYEDVTMNAKALTQAVPSGLQLFSYDVALSTLHQILTSAATGTSLLLLLCSSENVLTMFRTIGRKRLESHFAHWLLMTSDARDFEEMIFGLVGVIHEGTRTSLAYRKPLGKITLFSSRADGEGVVRFFSEDQFTLNSVGSFVFPHDDRLYKDMKGRVMKVAANDFEGFFGIDPSPSGKGEKRHGVALLGIDGNIVETLSDALNFTYDIVRPDDGYWGNPLPDGTITGVIGMTARREVGFALCAVAVTELRETVVDFSYPYSMETLALFSRAPKIRNRALAVLSPFSQEAWLCIVTAVLAIGPILSLQSRIYELVMGKKTERTIEQYSFSMFRTIVTQDNQLREVHWPQRSIIASWYLFCLVVTELYSGMLTAVLAIPSFEKPIDSLTDLPRAIQDGFTLGILKDTANEMIFREAKEGLFKETWELFNHKNPEESFITRPETGITWARDSKYIFIDLQISNEILITKMGRRKFHVGRQAFHPHGIGIACPPGVPYRDLFSKLLRRMMEAGLLSKWRRDELTKVANLAPDNDDSGSRTYAVNLTHLQAAFFVVVLGYLVAALVLMVEVIISISQKSE